MEEPTPVSFTTAGGKEVSFKAKRGRPKGSSKKVIETPVTPQELTIDQELNGTDVIDGKVFPVAIPAQAEPVQAEPVPPAEPVRMKPKARAKKPAAGLSEKLPTKTKIERPPELPTPEMLEPAPPPPPLERWQPSREDMQAMIKDYMQANKRSSRDSRVNMYRSWLTA